MSHIPKYGYFFMHLSKEELEEDLALFMEDMNHTPTTEFEKFKQIYDAEFIKDIKYYLEKYENK